MSNMYALLIAIDFYFPNQLPGGGSYPHLSGCVRDVRNVEAFLTTKLKLPNAHLFKLTATHANDVQPTELPEHWPTYANMVNAFKQLTALAQPGDQVYIHYSGHGGRAITTRPDLKGANGLDETLVPTDIGNAETHYLRDIELAHLLQTMIAKKLLVTLVLDSCHSGGATRGEGGARARGIAQIDHTPRPTDSLVASATELTATWNTLSAGGTRNVALGSGWLIQPQGYTLLAACRGTELANEYPFDNNEYNGALTYWLLKSFVQLGPGLTYKMLHERILARVHSQFENQTPQLQGEGDRTVFGSEHIQAPFAATVLKVEAERLLIEAGQVHGVRKGAQFAIYPVDSLDFTQSEKRLALAELASLGGTDSWVNITSRLSTDPIEPGAQAVVLDTANVNLQRPVRFVTRRDLPASIDQATALAKAQQALSQTHSTFAQLATDNDPVAFQVVINPQGEYEIWDPEGAVLPNLRPALAIAGSDAPARLAQRLIQLAKYRNVQELSNFDSLSPLANKFTVELMGTQKDYDPADPPKPQPLATPSALVMKPNEWVFIRIRNLLPKINDPHRPWLNSLNITVLDLQPDWGVTQIYPGDNAFSLPLDPQGELILPLQAVLPSGYTSIKDIIKVFATLGTTNFRWLELSPLDQPTRSLRTRGDKPADPLAQMLETVAGKEPTTRQLNPASTPSKEWITAQVEIHTANA